MKYLCSAPCSTSDDQGHLRRELENLAALPPHPNLLRCFEGCWFCLENSWKKGGWAYTLYSFGDLGGFPNFFIDHFKYFGIRRLHGQPGYYTSFLDDRGILHIVTEFLDSVKLFKVIRESKERPQKAKDVQSPGKPNMCFSPNSSGAEWGSQFFQETGFVPSSFPGSG